MQHRRGRRAVTVCGIGARNRTDQAPAILCIDTDVQLALCFVYNQSL
ncbi:hypothetical protein [Rhodococcus sp. ACT016]